MSDLPPSTGSPTGTPMDSCSVPCESILNVNSPIVPLPSDTNASCRVIAQNMFMHYCSTSAPTWEYYTLIKEYLNFVVCLIPDDTETPSQRVSQFLIHSEEVLKNVDYRIENFINVDLFKCFFCINPDAVNSYVNNLNIEFKLIDDKMSIIPKVESRKRKGSGDSQDLPLKNKFSALEKLSNELDNLNMHTDVDDNSDKALNNNTTITPPPSAPQASKKERCSALYQLFFEIDSNLNANLENIHKLARDIKTSYVGDKIRIEISDPETFRKIQAYLLSNKIPTRSLDRTAVKPAKFVLRGLPLTTNIEDIVAALRNHEIEPLHIALMRNRKTKLPMPLFLLTLKASPGVDQIDSLKIINYLTVSFEPYKFKNVAQCYRCQRYGHSSFVCSLTPRCVRCSGPHLKNECNTQPDKFVCANCNGNHAANYRGCPAHPDNKNKPKKPVNQPSSKFIPAPPPSSNVWAERAKKAAQTAATASSPPSGAAPATPPTPKPQRPPPVSSTPPPNQGPAPPPTPAPPMHKTNCNSSDDDSESHSDFAGIGELFKTFLDFFKQYNVADILNLFKDIASTMNSKRDTMTKLLIVCEKISSYFSSTIDGPSAPHYV